MSSTSASSAMRMITSTSSTCNKASGRWVTLLSDDAFFQFVHYCGGAALSHAGRLPDATGVESRIDDVCFDLR